MATPTITRQLISAPTFSASSSICRTCRRRLTQLQSHPTQQARPLATKPDKPDRPTRNRASQKPPIDANTVLLPRWADTPKAMQAPYKVRPANENDDFPINEDPAKLQRVLATVLGSEDAVAKLPEELRWLCVTHKSFDHGRRGFNDRLAFLGKRLLEMNASLSLLEMPQAPAIQAALASTDEYGRTPYVHHALKGIENLPMADKLLDKERLAGLAKRYGLQNVIRWKPRQVQDMKASGLDGVLVHTLYAIVGAIALQRGGQVAVQTVRQRILEPLGVQ